MAIEKVKTYFRKGAMLIAAAGDVKIDHPKYKARFGKKTKMLACGSSNSAIELTIPELEKYSAYVEWIGVCKGYE